MGDEAKSKSPFVNGYNAGIQAAWEEVNKMVNSLPTEPHTNNVRMMRDAALDIADAVLALKYGDNSSLTPPTKEG